MNPSDNKVNPPATIGSRLASIDSRVRAIDSKVDAAMREMVSSAIVGTAMVRLAVRAVTFRKPRVVFSLPDIKGTKLPERLAQVASIFSSHGFNFHYGDMPGSRFDPKMVVTLDDSIPCQRVWYTTKGPYGSLKQWGHYASDMVHSSDIELVCMDESDLKEGILTAWEETSGEAYQSFPFYDMAQVPYLTERATYCLHRFADAYTWKSWSTMPGTARNLILRAFFELVQSGQLPLEEVVKDTGFQVEKALELLSGPIVPPHMVDLEKL